MTAFNVARPMRVALSGSASVSGDVNVSGLPSWRAGLAVNAWVEITGSAMSSLAPTNEAKQVNGVSAVLGPTARMDAWCGLSIDTRTSKVYSVANGGHGDYFGNEVCAIDLTQNAPAWVELLAGQSGNVVDHVTTATDRSHARYLNAAGGTAGTGKPCATHSYWGQQFIEAHDRAIRLGGSTSPVGSAFENVEAYNITSNAWDDYNANTEAPPYGYCIGAGNNGWTTSIGWAACKDPADECVYVVKATEVRKMTPAVTPGSATWSSWASAPFSPYTAAYGATAVDTTRNRLVWMLGDGGTIELVYWDLATGSYTTTTFPAGTAATAIKSATDIDGTANRPNASGLVYVPEIDKFLMRQRHAGGTVYSIDPATFAVSELSTTGGGSVPAFAGFQDEQGIYNRWLYVPDLGGVVYFPNASSNAWFLRTH